MARTQRTPDLASSPEAIVAALAVIGGLTRTVGNRTIAALGVVGGVTYGLAGGTFLFTDRLNFLFPGAGAIGLWAIAAGICSSCGADVGRHRAAKSSEELG